MDETGGEQPLLPLSPLPLCALAVWASVLRRDEEGFGRAVELLETVLGETVGLVSPRHQARLLLGLKAKIILDMFLQERPAPEIRCRFSHLFPDPNTTRAPGFLPDHPKIRRVEGQFRSLVQHLLCDPEFRTNFLQGESCQQYGECFLVALEKLLFELLLRLLQAHDSQPGCPTPCPLPLATVRVLSQLHPDCTRLLESLLPPGTPLNPETRLVLVNVDWTRQDSVPRGGGGAGDRDPPRSPLPRRVGSRGRRWARDGRGQAASPPTAQKENAAVCETRRLVRRRLDTATAPDRQWSEVRAAAVGRSSDTCEVVSDSDSDSGESLAARLCGKRPHRLYQRTKHNTFIPTLLQHLSPPPNTSSPTHWVTLDAGVE